MTAKSRALGALPSPRAFRRLLILPGTSGRYTTDPSGLPESGGPVFDFRRPTAEVAAGARYPAEKQRHRHQVNPTLRARRGAGMNGPATACAAGTGPAIDGGFGPG